MSPNRRSLGPWLAAPWLPARAIEAAKPVLRVAMGRDRNDQRYDFASELLRLLLDALGQKVEWVPVFELSQLRIERELADGNLDVGILPTIGERIPGVLAVRVPIRRGLLGVRLLLARRQNLAALAAVRTLRELKKGFTLGHGSDWLDLEVMRSLGFRVVTGSTYTGLFQMLHAGRFDFLSRGVNEVWHELDNPALVSSDLAIVPGLALYMPLDDYFHVGSASTDWAPRLRRGFEIVLRDGRYARLFQKHFGAAFRRAGLANRRVLLVTGYGIDPGTPLDQFDVLELRGTGGVLKPPPVKG